MNSLSPQTCERLSAMAKSGSNHPVNRERRLSRVISDSAISAFATVSFLVLGQHCYESPNAQPLLDALYQPNKPPEGVLHAFLIFTEKEHSAENVQFWSNVDTLQSEYHAVDSLMKRNLESCQQIAQKLASVTNFSLADQWTTELVALQKERASLLRPLYQRAIGIYCRFCLDSGTKQINIDGALKGRMNPAFEKMIQEES